MPEAIFLQAYLNGKELEKCVAADVKYGFAIVLAEDNEGKITFDDNDDNLMKCVKGKIEIKDTRIKNEIN